MIKRKDLREIFTLGRELDELERMVAQIGPVNRMIITINNTVVFRGSDDSDTADAIFQVLNGQFTDRIAAIKDELAALGVDVS